MRYHFFQNFDDYPGFQPKTTFLYYFAHDCKKNLLLFPDDLAEKNQKLDKNYIFFSLFSDDLVEKNQKEVTIHDLDPLALTLLVDFSYTGEIVISEDNVQVSHFQLKVTMIFSLVHFKYQRDYKFFAVCI